MIEIFDAAKAAHKVTAVVRKLAGRWLSDVEHPGLATHARGIRRATRRARGADPLEPRLNVALIDC